MELKSDQGFVTFSVGPKRESIQLILKRANNEEYVVYLSPPRYLPIVLQVLRRLYIIFGLGFKYRQACQRYFEILSEACWYYSSAARPRSNTSSVFLQCCRAPLTAIIRVARPTPRFSLNGSCEMAQCAAIRSPGNLNSLP